MTLAVPALLLIAPFFFFVCVVFIVKVFYSMCVRMRAF